MAAYLMPDGRRRSREHWTDTMEDGPANPPAHTHRLPPVVRIAVVGLVAAVFLLLVAVGLLSTYVYKQQQYISGRGEFRDQETARLEEQIRQGQCDLLDTFPADVPALERARAKYQCGPGIPRALLTPEEQQRYGDAPAAATPVPLAPTPPLGSPASPGAPRPAPNTPAPGNGLPPESSPAPASPTPLVNLGPITNPLCDALGICI